MKVKLIKASYLWIAFGVGCTVALFLPSVWITRILAVTVIILGIMCCKK